MYRLYLEPQDADSLEGLADVLGHIQACLRRGDREGMGFHVEEVNDDVE